ncbi:winged helix DNA-binding domain-containing protein [Microbacterium oryzae]|uniref:Winged helix DNA-binding domain-containing protein n=1 Tax=Microbacterium oryzae TaxID=743009 RepID=A0A6I6DWJ1_9MICO|nr:winged helix DNA-binding domain-containing protein [Microbacterium oryzae]QGU28536.1 winged helix DNA-binding domain-containing protein [Microbacterium oryzae]
MHVTELRRARLRHHRLIAPAATVVEAARHLAATQSQDLWGGRLALAARTRDAGVSAVDRAFDDGALVRAWTQRGTLHTVAAEDLGWMLSVTGARMLRGDAKRIADLGLGGADVARAETLATRALLGGGRLTRAELLAVWEADGLSTAGQRGYHLIATLAIRGLLVWGPVVRREGLEPREQHLVLADEWIRSRATPADPAAELFARYIAGHGPATVRDFAWWAGLPLGASRAAAGAAAHRLRVVDEEPEPHYAAPAPPRARANAPATLALPTFEEYCISYADRSATGSPAAHAAVGPGRNGMVRPIIVHEGEIVGVWKPPAPSVRADGAPALTVFDGAPLGHDEATSAVDRALAILRS